MGIWNENRLNKSFKNAINNRGKKKKKSQIRKNTVNLVSWWTAAFAYILFSILTGKATPKNSRPPLQL